RVSSRPRRLSFRFFAPRRRLCLLARCAFLRCAFRFSRVRLVSRRWLHTPRWPCVFAPVRFLTRGTALRPRPLCGLLLFFGSSLRGGGLFGRIGDRNRHLSFNTLRRDDYWVRSAFRPLVPFAPCLLR